MKFNFNRIIKNQGSKTAILILLACPSVLSARKLENTVWIKAPQMPFKEFKAHLKILDTSHISYAQNKLNQKRKLAKSFQLKEKLLVAQKLYLSGEEKKAIEIFQEITKLSTLADWDEEDRRIILYSFLRRAQSEEDSEKRKALLFSASDFVLFKITSSNYSDYDLFPPPLMEELKLIQGKANFLSVYWKKIFPDYEIILINGKQIQINQKTILPQAFYRISAFSSSHQAWSHNLNLSELLSQKIKTKNLTTGPCENLQVKDLVEKINLKILPVSNCPKQSILKFKEHKRVNKKNQFNNLEDSQLEDLSLSSLEKLSNNSENSSFKQLSGFMDVPNRLSDIPAWLIVGAGVVTFVLIISLNEGTTEDSIYRY